MILLGIAGGTGSGKTTVANEIHKALGGEVTLIAQDCYYKDRSGYSIEERGHANYDHPDSIDFDLMLQHLKDLKNSKFVQIPVYDFVAHTRKREVHVARPTEVVLVEGILLFAVPELREVFDVKIYVDADDDIRLLRRLKRDITERGRDFESVFEQYLSTVKPMHLEFVEPSKRFADVIIPRGGKNNAAIDLVVSHLKTELNKVTSHE